MFSDSNQQELRQMYFSVWEKHKKKETLSPLEQQILTVILEHPEYQATFNNSEKFLEKTYHSTDGETNPFLHLGLHLGVREQLATNRPTGIINIYKQLCEKYSEHDAQHQMMQCLAEALFQAQQNNDAPSDEVYLRLLAESLRD